MPSANLHQRDADLWFPDGNIILIASGTGFRVYQGLLAAQSQVFRGMFACASHSVEETYEGCAVVQLSDSPEDLRRLLKFLIPASRRMFYPGSDNESGEFNFDEVSAVVRLAHKYNIADLEAQARSVLQRQSPKTLRELEAGVYPIKYEKIHAVPMVNLAHLLDMPQILPFALYPCCTLCGRVINCWKREDGTVEYLSAEDLRRVINGRDALAHEAACNLFYFFGGVLSHNCQCPQLCKNTFAFMLADIVSGKDTCDVRVLASWRPYIETVASDTGLCGFCLADLLKRDEERRREVFNSLPAIFGLEIEGWGD